jgi:hypothetical protein
MAEERGASYCSLREEAGEGDAAYGLAGHARRGVGASAQYRATSPPYYFQKGRNRRQRSDVPHTTVADELLRIFC